MQVNGESERMLINRASRERMQTNWLGKQVQGTGLIEQTEWKQYNNHTHSVSQRDHSLTHTSP